ncbi:Maf-like protein [Phocaeicola plebeius]|jgi:septum formation protein|uniref:Maf-like protein n=1 Tax=Phocaeicola plebeius TaxID=310297 RepID=UPI0026EF26E2|nr:Maf-like protein [Phocaeicola plebeius]
MKPLENIQHYKIVLASNSPRRRELLSGLNLEYTVRVLPDIDESYPDTLKGEEIPMYISREKAEAYRNSMAEDELIITADTVVCINEKVLGKPQTLEEAKEMLRELSGKTHQVITGVCLMTRDLQRTFSATTQVTFDVLTEDEIEFYVEKFRPLDKAGAYGVQEWIGFVGVSRLEGSYFNVMGLPVQRLYQELKKL